MKKLPLIIIIVSIVLLSVGLVFIFSSGSDKSKNEVDPAKQKEKKKEESTNPEPYDQVELYDILSGWAQDLYQKNNYDKCVKNNDGTCFLSLVSLEKDYGKDISKFKDEKRGGCLLETSGITFNMNNKEIPFSFSLEGCEYLDNTDIPEPSQIE